LERVFLPFPEGDNKGHTMESSGKWDSKNPDKAMMTLNNHRDYKNRQLIKRLKYIIVY